MSVHGEFDRYLDATLAALRDSGRPGFRGWADEIEAQVTNREEPLEERARRVLDGPLGQRDSEWQGFAPVEQPADRLVSISRIILGR